MYKTENHQSILGGSDFQNDVCGTLPDYGFLFEHIVECIRISPDRKGVKMVSVLNPQRKDNTEEDDFTQCVRTSERLPINRYFFYFEVSINEIVGEICIGFAGENFDTFSKIGVMPNSIAISSEGVVRENINVFGKAKINLKKGDVIGCGVLFNEKKVFFSHNGGLVRLLQNSSESFLFGKDAHFTRPAVSLSRTGDSLSSNFGEADFKFDVFKFVRIQKEIFIKNKEILPQLDICDNLLKSFITKYLLYNGFEDTFKSLESQRDFKMPKEVRSGKELEIQRKSLPFRKKIISLINEGNAEEALEQVMKEVGSLGENLDFLLKCQVFFELLREEKKFDAIKFSQENLSFYVEEKAFKGKFEEPLRIAISHLSLTSDIEALTMSRVYSAEYRREVASRVNDMILWKAGEKVQEPLGLLFKHIFAVDALERFGSDYFGLPLNFSDYEEKF